MDGSPTRDEVDEDILRKGNGGGETRKTRKGKKLKNKLRGDGDRRGGTPEGCLRWSPRR